MGRSCPFDPGCVDLPLPTGVDGKDAVRLCNINHWDAGKRVFCGAGTGVNRSSELPPLAVTTITRGVGATLLLLAGAFSQGVPQIALRSWAIIIWLAIVNTAVAFALWNHTLRTLTAAESSVINNTMLIQIALLAWLFLGEDLNWKEIVSLVAAGLGALLVQIHSIHPSRRDAPQFLQPERY